MKYERIYNRSKECCKLYDETKDTNYLMEDDCIAHLYECEGFKNYEKILDFAKQHGFKKVYDIGCAYGHQSEVFLGSGVQYVGINEDKCQYWNEDKFEFISRHYPFEIKASDEDLAVSVLCLTWNCYLYEKEKTLREQCEALQRDFKNCLLYMAPDKIEFVKRYFKNCRQVDEEFIYFSN